MAILDTEPSTTQKCISPEAAEHVIAAILRLGGSPGTMFGYDFNIVPPSGKGPVTEASVTSLGDVAGRLVFAHGENEVYIRLEGIPEDADDPLAAVYRAAAD